MTSDQHAEKIVNALSEYIYVYANPKGWETRYQADKGVVGEKRQELIKAISEALKARDGT